MSRSLFSKIHELAEFLGISMDIKHADPVPETTPSPVPPPPAPAPEPAQIFESPTVGPEQVDSSELAEALTKDLTSIVPKVLARAAQRVAKRPPAAAAPAPAAAAAATAAGVTNRSWSKKVVNILPKPKPSVLPVTLPMCCWHCNTAAFGSLNELQDHLKSHNGDAPKNIKKHKCQKCKKVKLEAFMNFFAH